MEPSLFIIPLVISVALVFCYGLGRCFVQLWALHRKKEALLRRFDENPAAFESAQDVIKQISEQEQRNQRAARQDYTLTGTSLGLLIALIGYLVQALSRPLVEAEDSPQT